MLQMACSKGQALVLRLTGFLGYSRPHTLFEMSSFPSFSTSIFFVVPAPLNLPHLLCWFLLLCWFYAGCCHLGSIPGPLFTLRLQVIPFICYSKLFSVPTSPLSSRALHISNCLLNSTHDIPVAYLLKTHYDQNNINFYPNTL